MAGWDVIVAGAGPAGAMAAHLLARAGCRPLLCDAVRPGPRIGEALPGAAARLLSALDLPSLDRAGLHGRIRGNLSAWGSARLEATDFFGDPNGMGWRLDRAGFDLMLREAAVASGAHFRATRIERVERARRWRIRFTDGTEARSHWLIDATGRASSVARRVGAKRSYDARLVALYAFGLPRAGVEFDRTLVEAVSNGWWYAAWLPSGAPVAAWHLEPRAARQVRAVPGAWRRALRRTRHVGAMLDGAKFAGEPRAVEAGGAYLDPFAGEGWIACGDAALSFDPISGQGLWSALQTGRLAGEAVLAALNRRTAVIDGYKGRLDEIRRSYIANQWTTYRQEDRWPAETFWAKRRTL